jgi:hypothetical protein
MVADSIPVLSCRESERGWFAAEIQMARHWEIPKRTSANMENARMKSGTM